MAAALRALRASVQTPPGLTAPTQLSQQLTVWWVRGLGLVGVALPMAVALGVSVHEVAQWAPWQALLDDPQWPGALRASVLTAALSTVLATAAAWWVTVHTWDRPGWARLQRRLAPMLAVPHAAWAVGWLWLFMPSGWIARALAELMGWTAPPDWRTVQDPWGLSLTLALVGKELPFVWWMLGAWLARPDVALRWRQALVLGCSVGYSRAQVWWRVLAPAVWPGLFGPVLAVSAYSLTVVDMALILGPGAPPTLAVLAWQWLLDADPARNAQGAAAALGLAAVWGCGGLLVAAAGRLSRGVWRAWAVQGWRVSGSALLGRAATDRPPGWVRSGLWGFNALWVLVAAVLGVASISGVWRFPALWPQTVSFKAWLAVWASGQTLGLTAGLGVTVAVVSVGLCAAWLAATPARWDRVVWPLLWVPLVVPALWWLVGVYRLSLWAGLDGSGVAVVWVHSWMALPYVWATLQPAWRSFDPRHAALSYSLGHSAWGFALRVKLPLLAAPLSAALAVALAVSVGQYVSTQFIGAGQWATLTTEAVTLAAGGQRSTAAAYAVLQAVLPLLGFGWAARWARRQERLTATATAPAMATVVEGRT